jgi:hypothetical protein
MRVLSDPPNGPDKLGVKSMLTVATKIEFSFMSAGPRYELMLPAEFESVPELNDSLANGIGARGFDFLPAGHSNGIPERYPVIETLLDREGRQVDLYQWPFEPPQWYLRWHISKGSLWTHLREEDGAAMAAVTIRALSILEDQTTGLPFLLLEPPLRRAVSTRPGYQELATFVSSVRPNWFVYLRRPGFVSPGKVVQSDVEPDLRVIRVGLPSGIEVQGVGTETTELQGVVMTVAESLTEASWPETLRHQRV